MSNTGVIQNTRNFRGWGGDSHRRHRKC